MNYKVIEHTADIGLKVTGKTLGQFYENAAFGMFSMLSDPKRVKAGSSLAVEAHGIDLETLLVAWLNELLYLSCKRKTVFSWFKAGIKRRGRSEYVLKGIAKGEKIARGNPAPNFEIKAATYHGLKVKKIRSGYSTTIYFDI